MSDPSIRINRNQLEALKRALRSDPQGVLGGIGVVLLAQAQKAFREQRFGDVEWPHRYPNQTGETLNVAGAVEDLRTGPRIKKRRYDKRPVGSDTGDLKRRLTFRVTGGNELEVGSDVPYASKFHSGGESTQRIGPSVKQNLGVFLRRQRKRRQRSGQSGPSLEQKRLGFLFGVTELTTTSPPRPFLGMTDDTGDAVAGVLRDVIRRQMQSESGGNGGDQQ